MIPQTNTGGPRFGAGHYQFITPEMGGETYDAQDFFDKHELYEVRASSDASLSIRLTNQQGERVCLMITSTEPIGSYKRTLVDIVRRYSPTPANRAYLDGSRLVLLLLRGICQEMSKPGEDYLETKVSTVRFNAAEQPAWTGAFSKLFMLYAQKPIIDDYAH